MAEFSINYGSLLSLSNEVEATANTIKSLYYNDYFPAGTDLWSSATGGITQQLRRNVEAVGDTIHNTYQHLHHVRDTMRAVNEMCVKAERDVLGLLSDRVTVAAGGFASGANLSASFADERDQQKADEQAAADKAKADADKAKADAEAKAEEERAKRERLLELLAKFFPETYAAYLKKLSDAERDAFLAELKESDPELYELAMAELKRQEEAEKAAAEAAAALGESGGLDGLPDSSGLADAGLGTLGGGGGLDFGGGSGDGGGLDFGGSDLGGLGDDWSSDLLGDTLGDDLLGAQDELAGYAEADPLGAVASGADALANNGDLAEADAGFWDEHGPQLAALVQAYGVQAAAAVGGAAVLYATREQTTEAVAHIAEFVSTKCRPAMDDVMKQVSGAAKKTRVSLSNTKSRAVGIARGEEAGGLLG